MDSIDKVINDIKISIDRHNKKDNILMVNLYRHLLLCRQKKNKRDFFPLYHLFLKNIIILHNIILLIPNINLQKKLSNLQQIILSS